MRVNVWIGTDEKGQRVIRGHDGIRTVTVTDLFEDCPLEPQLRRAEDHLIMMADMRDNRETWED